MNYLLDSNVFSDLMDEHPKVSARLASLSPADRVAICTITRGEILYGLRKLPESRQRDELTEKAGPLFELLQCEPVAASAADHYADVKVAQQRRGRSVGENDLWIAATAIALGATLVTRDSDFQNIEGLTVENWDA